MNRTESTATLSFQQGTEKPKCGVCTCNASLFALNCTDQIAAGAALGSQVTELCSELLKQPHRWHTWFTR